MDGEKHGPWVFRFDPEDRSAGERGMFVNGRKHGIWVHEEYGLERFREVYLNGYLLSDDAAAVARTEEWCGERYAGPPLAADEANAMCGTAFRRSCPTAKDPDCEAGYECPMPHELTCDCDSELRHGRNLSQACGAYEKLRAEGSAPCLYCTDIPAFNITVMKVL